MANVSVDNGREDELDVEEEFLTVREAALLLRVSEPVVRRELQAVGFPASRLQGGQGVLPVAQCGEPLGPRAVRRSGEL